MEATNIGGLTRWIPVYTLRISGSSIVYENGHAGIHDTDGGASITELLDACLLARREDRGGFLINPRAHGLVHRSDWQSAKQARLLSSRLLRRRVRRHVHA